MSLGARRAAPAAVLVACALAAPAAHAANVDEVLVEDLAQVQGSDLPPLSSKPPEPLAGSTATPAPTASPTPAATATPQHELPRTGSHPGLAAIAGLSLLGAGINLRRLTPDGAPD